MPYTHRQLWLHKHYLQRVLYHCRMVTVGRRGRDGFCVHETSRSGLLSRSNVFHTRGEGQSFDYGAMNLFPVFPERDPQQCPFGFLSFFNSGRQDLLSPFSCGSKSAKPIAVYY